MVHFCFQNMRLTEMVEQYVEFRNTLFAQGLLDKQFTQLQNLQDECNLGLVERIAICYFNDSERIFNLLNAAISGQNIDYKSIDSHVHQMKGSSSSVGAIRVKNACVTVRGYCEICDAQLCQAGLQQIKDEFYVTKENIKKLIEMEKVIVGAGGKIPPCDG